MADADCEMCRQCGLRTCDVCGGVSFELTWPRWLDVCGNCRRELREPEGPRSYVRTSGPVRLTASP